jgi:hypothetical protein
MLLSYVNFTISRSGWFALSKNCIHTNVSMYINVNVEFKYFHCDVKSQRFNTSRNKMLDEVLIRIGL